MKIIKNFANRARKRNSRKFMSKLSAFLASVFISSITAITASADTSGSTDIKSNSLLKDILELLSEGIGLVGGIVLVWGVIQFALSIKNNHGNNIENGVLTMVCGGLVTAAAIFFNVKYF